MESLESFLKRGGSTACICVSVGVARSAVVALMNKPRVWMFGQYLAKGRRERRVRVCNEGSEGMLTGSHARMNDSRKGQLVANSVILS